MEGCKHTRHAATVDSVGEGGAFRAARTTWTPDRTGGGGRGIPSLRRRRFSLRRQSPTPMPTTHSVAVDNRRYYAHIANAAEVESRRPTLWYGLRRASSLLPLPTRDLHRRTPIVAMVRPPVTTKLLLGLYSLFYSCTIALDAVVDSVTITDQRVPGAVLNGTEYVVLDCVYKLKPEEAQGLVITWYFNNSPSPAYQWIQGQPPRAIGPLKNHIRLGYAAPTDDALATYRALYIIRPTTGLTGNYKCVVSTYNDEDFMIKKMIVYAPGQHMHMKRTKANDQAMVNISCTISKVFPMPKMQLYKLETNGTEHRNSSLPIEILDYQNDGAFDVTISTLFSESELPSRTTFFCELIIPSTPYNITKRFVYNPGNTESLSADNAAWSRKLSQTLKFTTIVWLFIVISN
ncbi:uncharacterized protein LOC114129278 [Aphis gossypii]|uniref:Ig-like domain-containing protein n=1 Tax=Aphis gossypii TaxID=80765 RepID=A0A9P0NMJ2_APHGO|nr:uncharacterized protein LOC114129278 [Aphis gossypii]CAH1732597.1 unnamed protein product [Aphis gossypii]